MATMTIQLANGRTMTVPAMMLMHGGQRRAGLHLIRRAAAVGYPCAVMCEDLHRAGE